MKKLIALLMTITMLFSVTVATAGCKKPTSFGDGDDVVIQFQLDNLGFGTHWLQESCERFMEKQKDVEYPGGKKGVYCHIVRGNTPTANNIQQSGSHVVFRGGKGDQLAETGNVWGIPADFMSEKLPGETRSIEDKLYPESRAQFKAADGKYYTLPAHEIYAGISYDMKLFNKYGFYFARQLDGGVNATDDPDFLVSEYESYFGDNQYFRSNLINQNCYFVNPKPIVDDYADVADYEADVALWEKGKSCGPNGIYGDYDDGLASSLYELFALWEFMAAKKVNPMLVSGHQKSLANAFLDAMPHALMGYEKSRTTYDLSGQVDAVIGFSYGGLESTGNLKDIQAPIVQNVNITEETGYYSTWGVEKYLTYAAMEVLLTNGFLDESSYPGSSKEVNHLGAQKKFLDSGHEIMGGTGAEIGMLMEYSYWWNESSIRGNVDAFESLNGKADREIRWMPLPVNVKEPVTGEDKTVSYRFASIADGTLTGTMKRDGTEYVESKKGEKNLLVQTHFAGMIIGKKAMEVDPAAEAAVKDWLKFFHSDEELSAVTASQGFRKALDYEMTGADRDKWAPFYRDLYDLSEKSDIFRPASDTETYYTASSTIMSKGEGNSAWNCKHGQYFGCWTKTPNMAEKRSSHRCWIESMVPRADWSKYYKGGEHTENITYLCYPGTTDEIVFVNGDENMPI